MRLFVVHEEGGLVIFIKSMTEWVAETKVRPIWGVRIGPLELAHDSILHRSSGSPWGLFWRNHPFWVWRLHYAQRAQRLLSTLEAISA